MSKESIDVAMNAPHIATAKVFAFESLSTSCRLQGAIGYEVGTKDHLHVRILSSDGPGKFNRSWWSLADIEKALAGIPEHEPFKPAVLAPVFAGRSVNSMYFVISALLNLSLLRRADPVENGYVRNVPADLLSELQSLVAAGTDLSPPSMDDKSAHIALKVSKSSKKAAAPATN